MIPCFNLAFFRFVRFKTAESAKRAREDLHRWELKGNKITVEISKESLDHMKTGKKVCDMKVYPGGCRMFLSVRGYL